MFSFSVKYERKQKEKNLYENLYQKKKVLTTGISQTKYSQPISHSLSVFKQVMRAHSTADLYNQKMTLLKERDCFWSWPHLRLGLFMRQPSGWTFILSTRTKQSRASGRVWDECVMIGSPCRHFSSQFQWIHWSLINPCLTCPDSSLDGTAPQPGFPRPLPSCFPRYAQPLIPSTLTPEWVDLEGLLGSVTTHC